MLLQINAPICRRLHVRSDSGIATLHELILGSSRPRRLSNRLNGGRQILTG